MKQTFKSRPPAPRKTEPGLFGQPLAATMKVTAPPRDDYLFVVLVAMVPALGIDSGRKEANEIHKSLTQMNVKWWELEAGFKKYKNKYTKSKLGWAPSVRAMIRYWHDCKPTHRECLEALYAGWQHPYASSVRKHGCGFCVFLQIVGVGNQIPEPLLDVARILWTEYIDEHTIEATTVQQIVEKIANEMPAI